MLTPKDKIKHFMNEHPFNIAFIMEALRYYSNELLKNEDKVREDLKGGMIDPNDWLEMAREAKKVVE